MATVTFRILQSDDPELVLDGEISRAGAASTAVPGPIVVKPTQRIAVALARGSYVFEFNVSASGKFTVVAGIPSQADQSKSFDTARGDQDGGTFAFEVCA